MNDQAAGVSIAAGARAGASEGAPRISGEFIRQALLGEADIPPDCPLKIDGRGAQLEGVVVEGSLDLSAIKLGHPLTFVRCTFERGICLRSASFDAIAFIACSAPMLDAPRAEVAGDFDLSGTTLDNPTGVALSAAGLRAMGNVCLVNLTAFGAVNLSSAFIGDTLDLRGACLRYPVKEMPTRLLRSYLREMALCCTGIEIRQNALLIDGFLAEGFVGFQNAQAAALIFYDCSIIVGSGKACALFLTGARARGVNFGAIRRFEGEVSLSPATTIRFGDDGTLWRDASTGKVREGVSLRLGAFHYEGLLPLVGNVSAHNNWRTRLAWLKAQPKEDWTVNFNAAPFTRLANVLREMGDAHGARMILFERERLRLKSNHVGFLEKIGGHILGVFAGYGYKNHLALYWALCIWLLGAGIFWTADVLGQMRPADPHVLAEEHYQETLRPPTDYEPVKPLLYSADILLPIVELGQQEYWLPRDAGEQAADVEHAFPNLARPLRKAIAWLFGGWLPKAYYYFEIFMGWLLVSIVIAGFSGLLGHAKEE